MDNMFDDIEKDQGFLLWFKKPLNGSDDGELFFETTPSESFLFDDW
jgi:hypothetical protein